MRSERHSYAVLSHHNCYFLTFEMFVDLPISQLANAEHDSEEMCNLLVKEHFGVGFYKQCVPLIVFLFSSSKIQGIP